MSERMSHPFPPKHSMHWRTSPYTYEQAVSEYDAKGHLLDLTEKPNQASDDQAGSPPEHSLFWQGQTEPIDSVTSEPIQWIEIRIVDEFNQPLDSVVGKLTDANGKVYPVRAARSPIYVQGLAAGQIALSFENQSWFECVEKRKPNLSADDPVQAWLDENQLGKRASQVKLLTATAGDFVELTPNQSLAQRHHAGQADDIVLETGNSYLIRIQGFNYISLHIGVFFDGTANNSYKARWGKRQLDSYSNVWQQKYQLACQQVARQKNISPSEVLIKDLPEECFLPPVKAYQDSAANELTNIEKLYQLYKDYQNDTDCLYNTNELRTKLYITGIGTDNSEQEVGGADNLLGLGLGVGPYGIIAKVDHAIEQIHKRLNSSLNYLQSAALPFLDGIGEVVFDVFGFSRGAAAGRHLVNIISDGESSALAKALKASLDRNTLLIATGFNWQRDYWRAGFVGIFDTVASVVAGVANDEIDLSTHNTNNGDVRLWIDDTFVDNVVHIVANSTTEYRYDFSLNKLNTGSGRKFHEYTVPGAHSDLGGGYHSRTVFNNEGYLLPLLENKLIARASQIINEDSIFQKSMTTKFLIKRLNQRRLREKANGWPVFEPERNYVTVIKERRIGRQIEMIAELRLRRIVEGDLSRLYLRLMFGLAQYYGVVFTNESDNVWTDKDVSYFSVQDVIGNMDFGAFAERVLSLAKQGKVYSELASLTFLKQLMRNNLIHHSAFDSIGMRPNDEGKPQFYRAAFNCRKPIRQDTETGLKTRTSRDNK
ncbi:DUF2235 domain-containing protein [Vibrio xiamenensis]|nr:DUF2235 domain-containing protein [Vibrio xiamenensis]